MDDKRTPRSADYRAEFYAQYHRAVNTQPQAPAEDVLRRLVRQFAGRWDKWLPADRGARCLDIGCGTGEFLYYLRERGFAEVEGLDLNAEELRIARELGAPRLHQSDAVEHLRSVDEGTYGLISGFNFFEHLNKAELLTILPAIRRALAPGGALLAVTPNGLSPFSGATRYWDFSHELSFTPASWRQLSRLAGFHEASFEEYGPLPHSVPGVARVLAWRAIRASLAAISYVEVGSPRDPSSVYTADMKIILRR
jgi:SAM-dependent methyltransferase